MARDPVASAGTTHGGIHALLTSAKAMPTILDPKDDTVKRIHRQLTRVAQLYRGPVLSTKVLTKKQLVALIDTAFWASLIRNEARPTRVRIAVGISMTANDVLAFKEELDYEEGVIANLAPAVHPTGYLAVRVRKDRMKVWGIAPQLSPTHKGVTLEISDPGVVRVGIGSYEPFAVLSGRSITFPESIKKTNLAAYLQQVLRKNLPTHDILETQAVARECSALAALAVMVLQLGHGGALLVVPAETGDWRNSLQPFPHEFTKPDSRIRDFIRSALEQTDAQGKAQERLSASQLSDEDKSAIEAGLDSTQIAWYPDHILRFIARLADVDGALVLTPDLRVLGFGAKISVTRSPVVYERKPQAGLLEAIEIPIGRAGGTRHQSAVRFVGKHTDSVAVIISQDGHISVAHYSAGAKGVVLLRNAEWWS